MNWIDVNNDEIVFNVVYDFLDKKDKRNEKVEIFDHVLITIKVQDLTFKEIVFDENIFIVEINVKCWDRHCSESWIMIVCENNNVSFLIIFILFKLVVFVVIVFFFVFFCFFYCRVCVCFYNRLESYLLWFFHKLFSDVNVFRDIDRERESFYNKSRSRKLIAWLRNNEFNF